MRKGRGTYASEGVGREEFLRRTWAVEGNLWQHASHAQIKQSGQSPATGRRERFTMDEGCSRAVREVFVNLYEKGLIYPRSNASSTGAPTARLPFRMPRWNSTEQAGHFWHIKYPHHRWRGRLSRGGHHPSRKPCSAIPPLPSTPMMSATRHLIGKTADPAARGPGTPRRRR